MGRATTKQVLLVTTGMLTAVAMLVLSVLMAGYGHGGWALLPSVLSLVGWPLALSAWVAPNEPGRSRAVIALAIAVLADIVVSPGFVLELDEFVNVLTGGMLWVLLFAGWHAAAIWRLARARN